MRPTSPGPIRSSTSHVINPAVFIIGCPRSGTTLVRHIVGAHPLIAITPEAHWIPKWFEKRTGLTPDGLVTPDLIAKLLAHPKFVLFRLGREDLMTLMGNGEPRSYATFVTGIFDLYGKSHGKALVGNKTPDAVRKLDTLHAIWPQARFVHVIRDGRDVALSMFNWSSVQQKKPGTFATWKDDPASTAALWWELNVRRGREAGALLGPELYHEMRYESLVAHPERDCAALCAFLGLAYDEGMLRFHEARANADEAGVGPVRAVAHVLAVESLHAVGDRAVAGGASRLARLPAVAGELHVGRGRLDAVHHRPHGGLRHTHRRDRCRAVPALDSCPVALLPHACSV